jgi:hypothetical protein
MDDSRTHYGGLLILALLASASTPGVDGLSPSRVSYLRALKVLHLPVDGIKPEVRGDARKPFASSSNRLMTSHIAGGEGLS